MSDTHERQQLTSAAGLYRQGALAEAQAICKGVLKRNPRAVDALQLLGLIAFKNGELDQSAAHYQRCLKLSPREARFHYLLSKVHIARGEMAPALRCLDAALKLDPAYADAIAWKAVVLERRGEHAQARSLLEPLVAAGTDDGQMTETFARLELAVGRQEAASEVIARQLKNPGLAPLQRQVLLFLHAKAIEQAGDFDRAFGAYELANRSLHASFDALAYVREIDRLLQVFSAENFARLPRAKPMSGPTPVFIAGMPRSGTTLIEQIIDAHPHAHGAGELKKFEEIERSIPGFLRSPKPYPECILDLTQRDADRLSREYMDAVRRIGGSARVVVNKSLENYKQLGLVSLLLPQARIIHCRRDPLDTCASCYFSHLMPPRHAYACDLVNLAIVYRQYERLIRHWRDALGIPMLEVSYERLVAEPAAVSREIIAFCGLEWDERCLRPHESGRVAMTLSYDQVRRPIYASSVGRGARFQKHLRPLVEALGISSAS